MSGFSGANTEQLRNLANEGDQTMQVLTDAERLIDQLIVEMPAVWTGMDAERFIGDLHSIHKPAVVRAKARLEQAIVVMRRNAQAQDATSARLD